MFRIHGVPFSGRSGLEKKFPFSLSILFTMPDPSFGFWKSTNLPVLTNTAQPSMRIEIVTSVAEKRRNLCPDGR